MRKHPQTSRAGSLLVAAGLLALSACASSSAAGFSAPMDDFTLRAKVLTFGLHVTPDPADNPIDPPERFAGYHVATDVEVGADELNKEVNVYAICTGDVIYSGFAAGYGGLVVQHCRVSIQGVQDITVIYGHLSLLNLPGHGVTMKSGDLVTTLAPARTYESDGNRKHLHLGIHKGTAIDMRGYVQTKEEINDYIDPMSVLPSGGPGLLQSLIEPYWKNAGSGSTAS
ncbi:MAG TPA: peptidoglycan DD-metalloendopeptidase family protein [Candidatus Peribacteria bacterium]|nr:peptidoglycan DD-metalloendopeptidase family protein [Candidatus Peribacteria bacterium]